MTPCKNGQLLARVNFPPYAIILLSERHILVAGGGGQSKTGVENVIEIFELINSEKSFRAVPVLHYNTGKNVIMNCCALNNGKSFILAAGMGGYCHLYQMKFKVINNGVEPLSSQAKKGSNYLESSVRKRPLNKSQEEDFKPVEENSTEKDKEYLNENFKTVKTDITFEVLPLEKIQTDFNKNDEPYQKVVRITSDHSVIVTAGSDGHIRAWKFPGLKELYDIQAHSSEVDDLDISPAGDKMVSVSRDGNGYVWLVKTGEKAFDLKYTLPKENTQKYIFRNCRFSRVGGKSADNCLFTTLNPLIRQKSPLSCYLLKWNTRNLKVDKYVCVGTDVISALAVSPDGKFVGIGSLTGAVAIYISFSLQHLYHVEKAHNFFVTGLEFLSCSEETQNITRNMDTTLISISVDNHIVAHNIPKQSTVGLCGIVIFFMVFLFLIYVLMDYIQL